MKLKSCFKDYYDPYFDNEGETYWRVNEGPPKKEQLDLLDKEYKTPNYGMVRDLFEFGCEYVVAYTDEYAHTTMGKVLIHKDEFYENKNHPLADKLGTEFIGDPYKRPAISYRHLYIGSRFFDLVCIGYDSWMSNYGDGSWSVYDHDDNFSYHPLFNYPIYAIDFVKNWSKDLYAIDFNTCPGIGGTGVERFITGKEVVEEIKQWRKVNSSRDVRQFSDEGR